MKLLGNGGLLGDVKLNLKFSGLLGGLPFKWNKATNKLEIKSQKKQIFLGLRQGIAVLNLFLSLIQTFRVINRASMMVITHCILSYSCFANILSFQIPNLFNLSSVVQLFSGFIQLEQNFSKYFGNKKEENGRKSKTDWSLQGMIYLLTCTGLTGSTVWSLDIIRNPCLSAYDGYWMHSQCANDVPGSYLNPTWSFTEVSTKVTMSLFGLLVWMPLLCGCCFQIALEIVVEGYCFRVGIAKFGK